MTHRREEATEWVYLSSRIGQRNRAGAPLVGGPSYDAQLALKLLTAAQEVMLRVVADGDRSQAVGELAGLVRAMAGPSSMGSRGSAGQDPALTRPNRPPAPRV